MVNANLFDGPKGGPLRSGRIRPRIIAEQKSFSTHRGVPAASTFWMMYCHKEIQRMRVLKLAAAFALTGLMVMGGQGITVSRADTAPMNFHFFGYVLSGQDSGMMLDGILNVTVMGNAVTPVLTLGDGTVVNGMGSLKGKSITVSLPLGTKMGTVTGIGTSVGGNFLGSFIGPRKGDYGTWRAGSAPTTVSFGVTGSVSKGPSKDTGVVGDLLGVVEADGTMTGRYVDNSNANNAKAFGKTFPVHGFYANGNMTAAIMMSNPSAMMMSNANAMMMGKTLIISGRAGKFFGQDSFNGTILGPMAGDSGVVSGLAQ